MEEDIKIMVTKMTGAISIMETQTKASLVMELRSAEDMKTTGPTGIIMTAEAIPKINSAATQASIGEGQVDETKDIKIITIGDLPPVTVIATI